MKLDNISLHFINIATHFKARLNSRTSDHLSIALYLKYIHIRFLFSVAREVCVGENYRISCQTDEVIVMTSAEYGHMTEGRCITETDPRYAGCSNDVLPVLDKDCSGRRECNFQLLGSEVKHLSVDCPTFIAKYSNLEHTCVKGNLTHFLFILLLLFYYQANIFSIMP